MAWEPPRGTGQPRACADSAKTRPMALVARPSSGAITWATRPANRALERSSLSGASARWTAGDRARPKRARVTGSRGSAVSGRDMKSRTRVSQWARSGSMSLRYGPASRGPKEAAVSATERDSTAAVPSGNGWAMGSGACSHSRPYRSSGRGAERRGVDAEGWAAEQGSCRKPGRVSSSVRAPPPTVDFASNRATEKPAAGQLHGSGQSVRSRTHHDRIEHRRHLRTPSSADGLRDQDMPGDRRSPGPGGPP